MAAAAATAKTRREKKCHGRDGKKNLIYTLIVFSRTEMKMLKVRNDDDALIYIFKSALVRCSHCLPVYVLFSIILFECFVFINIENGFCLVASEFILCESEMLI